MAEYKNHGEEPLPENWNIGIHIGFESQGSTLSNAIAIPPSFWVRI